MDGPGNKAMSDVDELTWKRWEKEQADAEEARRERTRGL
jgi:hypothetical protein